MENIFSNVLKISVASSYVIVFILIFRLALKKSPKIFSYLLWSIVLFRLICPISFESSLSLMPKEVIDVAKSVMPKGEKLSNVGYENFQGEISSTISSEETEEIQEQKGKIDIRSIVSKVWIIGVAMLLLYNILSFINFKKRLNYAKHIKDNIYKCKNIGTAFVIGLSNPRIYIPEEVLEKEEAYIVAHEKVHIRRNDNIVKLISYLIVIIHWFNPLVWVSFILMSKDMEMSCDEAVMKELGSDMKKEYSKSLLSFATNKVISKGSVLAFGEGDVKARIKNVLNYKKPRLLLIGISMVVVMAAAFTLGTNPIKNKDTKSLLNINNALRELEFHDEVVLRKVGEGASIWKGKDFVSNLKKHIPDWAEHKVGSPYELSSDMEVYINSGDWLKLCFYENEPKLMAIVYNGETRYYKSNKNVYEEITIIKGLSNFYVPEEIMIAVADGKKTERKSVNDVPIDKDYGILNVGSQRYYIYEDDYKYYVEAPYYAIYHISKKVYEDAIDYGKPIVVQKESYRKRYPAFQYKGDDDIEKLIYDTLVSEDTSYDRDFTIISPKIYGNYEEEDKLKVFAIISRLSYKVNDKVIELAEGGIIPTALTFTKNEDGSYRLEEYIESGDGSHFGSSIKEFCTMPVSGEEIKGLADKIINDYSGEDIRELERKNLVQYLNDNNLKGMYLSESNYPGEDILVPLTIE